jgi:hypothetical protein
MAKGEHLCVECEGPLIFSNEKVEGTEGELIECIEKIIKDQNLCGERASIRLIKHIFKEKDKELYNLFEGALKIHAYIVKRKILGLILKLGLKGDDYDFYKMAYAIQMRGEHPPNLDEWEIKYIKELGEQFGTHKIAEITGRSTRTIWKVLKGKRFFLAIKSER